jgi:hypothetical protein
MFDCHWDFAPKVNDHGSQLEGHAKVFMGNTHRCQKNTFARVNVF